MILKTQALATDSKYKVMKTCKIIQLIKQDDEMKTLSNYTSGYTQSSLTAAKTIKRLPVVDLFAIDFGVALCKLERIDKPNT